MIGQNIRRIRGFVGMDQAVLSLKANISQPRLCQIEKGVSSAKEIELQRIADVFAEEPDLAGFHVTDLYKTLRLVGEIEARMEAASA